jgi:hypothetical protein
MSSLDDAINSLSSDELDMLNSDPQMLAQFKTKYHPSSPSSELDVLKDTAPAMPGVSGHLARTLSNIPGDIENNIKGAAGLAAAGLYGTVDPVGALKDLATSAPDMIRSAGQGIKDAVLHPIKTVEENPISTAMMIIGLGDMVPEAGGVEGELGSFVEALKKDSGLAKFNKKLLGVSESATKMRDAGMPIPSQEELDSAVENVIKAHKDVVSAFGEDLNEAKANAGLPASVEEKDASVRKYGNKRNLDLSQPLELHPDAPRPVQKGDSISVSGENLPSQDIKYNGPLLADSADALRAAGMPEDQITSATQPTYNVTQDVPGHPAGSTLAEDTLKKLGYKIPDVNAGPMPYKISSSKTAEDLNTEVGRFMNNLDYISDKDKVKAASYYQDRIKNYVPDFSQEGDETQGLLKSKYQQLKSVISEASPELQSAKSNFGQMKEALNLVADNLDPERPGKTQDFLKRIFTSTTEAANDQRQQLAYLEQLSGQPIISDLFKKFSGKEFSQLVGPTGERLLKKSAPFALTGALFGHPGIGMGGLAVEAAATSPRVVGALEAGVPAMTKNSAPVAALKTAQKGLQNLRTNPTLQSLYDKMRNDNAK